MACVYELKRRLGSYTRSSRHRWHIITWTNTSQQALFCAAVTCFATIPQASPKIKSVITDQAQPNSKPKQKHANPQRTQNNSGITVSQCPELKHVKWQSNFSPVTLLQHLKLIVDKQTSKQASRQTSWNAVTCKKGMQVGMQCRMLCFGLMTVCALLVWMLSSDDASVFALFA